MQSPTFQEQQSNIEKEYHDKIPKMTTEMLQSEVNSVLIEADRNNLRNLRRLQYVLVFLIILINIILGYLAYVEFVSIKDENKLCPTVADIKVEKNLDETWIQSVWSQIPSWKKMWEVNIQDINPFWHD